MMSQSIEDNTHGDCQCLVTVVSSFCPVFEPTPACTRARLVREKKLRRNDNRVTIARARVR